MRLFKILCLVVVLSALTLSGASTKWGVDALKLQHSIHTLTTPEAVNPFPGEAPGVVTAIGEKTDQLIADLAALSASLTDELPTLSAGERAEALDTYASLLMQTADAGQMLADRSLFTIVSGLGAGYTVGYDTYASMTAQYVIPRKTIPIYVEVNGRGGWPIPG